ncbi:hypothetical protein CYMTET_38134 [Cymbomonas tetramitiformis]|uniref:Uncharacterized protein n=1 Tax=Cymbomonas tetramitiformis TaxID=36881 RepID=A0AAE0CEC8_9CHLO|nr:hypothetical protein CYMTET_38134 [Cymbomonas tetramitiformis]
MRVCVGGISHLVLTACYACFTYASGSTEGIIHLPSSSPRDRPALGRHARTLSQDPIDPCLYDCPSTDPLNCDEWLNMLITCASACPPWIRESFEATYCDNTYHYEDGLGGENDWDPYDEGLPEFHITALPCTQNCGGISTATVQDVENCDWLELHLTDECLADCNPDELASIQDHTFTFGCPLGVIFDAYDGDPGASLSDPVAVNYAYDCSVTGVYTLTYFVDPMCGVVSEGEDTIQMDESPFGYPVGECINNDTVSLRIDCNNGYLKLTYYDAPDCVLSAGQESQNCFHDEERYEAPAEDPDSDLPPTCVLDCSGASTATDTDWESCSWLAENIIDQECSADCSLDALTEIRAVHSRNGCGNAEPLADEETSTAPTEPCQLNGYYPLYYSEESASVVSPSGTAIAAGHMWMPLGAADAILDGSYSGSEPLCDSDGVNAEEIVVHVPPPPPDTPAIVTFTVSLTDVNVSNLHASFDVDFKTEVASSARVEVGAVAYTWGMQRRHLSATMNVANVEVTFSDIQWASNWATANQQPESANAIFTPAFRDKYGDVTVDETSMTVSEIASPPPPPFPLPPPATSPPTSATTVTESTSGATERCLVVNGLFFSAFALSISFDKVF